MSDASITLEPRPLEAPHETRRAKVEQRAAQLMAEAFAANPPAQAWWTEAETAVRDRCLQQAQAEVPPVADADPLVHVAPRIALHAAIVERREAEKLCTHAKEIADRAKQRLATLEHELEAFRDLDSQVDAFRLEAARTGNFDAALPYPLETALRERSRTTDLFDRARTVADKLAAEAKAAEAGLAAKARIASTCASKLLQEHADALCDEWRKAQDAADERKAMLLALTYTRPAHSDGPIEQTRRLYEVLTTPQQPPDTNWETLQSKVKRWADAHTQLTGDADYIVDIG